jgi:hypothetical protein
MSFICSFSTFLYEKTYITEKTGEKNMGIREEMDPVIRELKEKNIKFTSNEKEVVGLGDVVEATLQKFGITEEKFKQWFNLQECNCTERKKFLNNLFSWHRKKKEEK